jgi:CIC family chloride channel protein
MSIGALIGYGFAELVSIYNFPVEPFYFAAIGAAVFMGVIMKLPLTAVVLAMETTFDYNVVIGTAISVIMVEYFSSLYFTIRKNYVTKIYKIKEELATKKEMDPDKEKLEIKDEQ